MPARSVGVLLAAGAGRRFDAARPGAKLEAPFDTETVGVRSLTTLMSAVDATIVAVRGEHTAIAMQAKQRGAHIVVPAHFEWGMGHSIAAAAALALAEFGDADVLLMALADMPWTNAQTLAKLIEQSSSHRILRPRFEGVLGHPVAFGREFWPALINCGGDEGARRVLGAHAPSVVVIDVADAGVLRDVDVPTDLPRPSASRTQH
ncbi:MAG: nucleotidyltransferase family protein [Betaproteobacteria bacterium]|nr:MAG: nucleotidyltransferase family protein [Betaproteobacteria bacterium]